MPRYRAHPAKVRAKEKTRSQIKPEINPEIEVRIEAKVGTTPTQNFVENINIASDFTKPVIAHAVPIVRMHMLCREIRVKRVTIVPTVEIAVAVPEVRHPKIRNYHANFICKGNAEVAINVNFTILAHASPSKRGSVIKKIARLHI